MVYENFKLVSTLMYKYFALNFFFYLKLYSGAAKTEYLWGSYDSQIQVSGC